MTDSPPDTPSGAGTTPKRRPDLRRHNRGGARFTTGSISSSVSSFSSFSSSSSSPPATPCCSSPSSRSFSVPFSWEHRPGIPKTKSPLSSWKGVAAGPTMQLSDVVLLPLPPPLRSNSDISPSLRKKRADTRHVPAAAEHGDDDPFAIALAQCAKDAGGSGDELEEQKRKEAVRRRRRSTLSPATMNGRFRLLQLYGSCKTAAGVAEATVRLPRSGPTGNGRKPRGFGGERT